MGDKGRNQPSWVSSCGGASMFFLLLANEFLEKLNAHSNGGASNNSLHRFGGWCVCQTSRRGVRTRFESLPMGIKVWTPDSLCFSFGLVSASHNKTLVLIARVYGTATASSDYDLIAIITNEFADKASALLSSVPESSSGGLFLDANSRFVCGYLDSLTSSCISLHPPLLFLRFPSFSNPFYCTFREQKQFSRTFPTFDDGTINVSFIPLSSFILLVMTANSQNNNIYDSV